MKNYAKVLSAVLLLGFFMFGTVSSVFADVGKAKTEQDSKLIVLENVVLEYPMEATTVYITVTHSFGTVELPVSVSYPTISRCNSPPIT